VSDAASVGKELIEAFNAGDWDRLRTVLTPDVDDRETGTGRHATARSTCSSARGGGRHCPTPPAR
jgi:hypothetical protein